MKRILVTGANGFVGSALCRTLEQRDIGYRAAVRTAGPGVAVAVGQLDGKTDWTPALVGCDTVIHLAARVHVMDERATDPLAAFRIVNVAATLNLARQAHAGGVRRMVFVSSVKVNGEESGARPFRADDVPRPCDSYGQSKLEAEQALLALGRETGLEVVIVRPPLVYGPGVKANFLALVKLVQKGLPLPFASLQNYRSMVALDNLVDLLVVCASHPRAAGKVFMAADGVDLRLRELVTMIGAAMGRKPVLVPVPAQWMRAAARMAGKSAVADRLLGTLQVDAGPTQAALEWRPVVTPQAAIEHTVSAYLASSGKR